MYRTIVILTLIITSCSDRNNFDQAVVQDADLTLQIEVWLKETGVPSVSYVLIKNGEIYSSRALGYANVAKEVPVDTETIYNTGSNFKAVTATAIMQLQEKGLMDIDQPVNTYLKEPIVYFDPEYPITARHLMSHQSGIPSAVAMTKIWERKQNSTLEELSAQVKPIARPGEKYQYANDGYVLLALLIENITGETFEDYIWKNILKPLDIETIDFLAPSPEMIENLALPYHIRYNRAYPTHQLHLAQYPAGDVFLTPADMAKFVLMHLNKGTYQKNTLLSGESIAAMHQPAVKVEEDFFYGLGFGIENINGKRYSSHQGSLPGYLSAFRMDFETQSAVYIATNVSASPLQEKQVQILLDLFMDYVKGSSVKEMQIPTKKIKAEELTEDISLKRYAGKYRIEGAPVYLTIDTIGNQLYLVNPAKQRFRLDCLEGNKFFLTTENEDVLFEEENGQITALSLSSGGNRTRAKKE